VQDEGHEGQNDDTFEYITEYEVLICTLHRTAVQGLQTHLRDTHGLDKKRRAPLLQKYGSLSLRRPKDVRLPTLGGAPF
jgi:hypothetical protein